MDAIDNSAGVDCSDHEVNIKILLDTIVADGDLTGKQRNAILAEMGGRGRRARPARQLRADAGDLELDCAGGVDGRGARALRPEPRAGRHARTASSSSCPTDEGFDERQAAGGGLTAPEFATLLSHTKIALGQELLASDLPEDPYLSSELERYFPTRLARGVRDAAPASPAAAGDHRLAGRQRPRQPRRNDLRLPAQRRDRRRRRRHRARLRRRRARSSGLRGLWAEIEALDGRVPAETQTAMLLRARILLERATRWLLRNRRRPIDIAAAVARYAAGCGGARRGAADPARPGRARGRASAGRGARGGRRSDRARASASRTSRRSCPTLDLVEIAAATELDVASAAAVYFALGARLELHWLRDRIVDLPRETRWEAMARAALRDDVYSEQAGLTAEVLRAGRRCRALAGRELERGRAVAAGARGHQERRHARPRPAVGRRARDPQPDPLERRTGAGRPADIWLVDLEALVRELERFDRHLVAGRVERGGLRASRATRCGAATAGRAAAARRAA